MKRRLFATLSAFVAIFAFMFASATSATATQSTSDSGVLAANVVHGFGAPTTPQLVEGPIEPTVPSPVNTAVNLGPDQVRYYDAQGVVVATIPPGGSQTFAPAVAVSSP